MNEIIIHAEAQSRIPDNSRLSTITNHIAESFRICGMSLYRVAFMLNEIDKQKIYEDGGYKSTVDYAKDVFGLKKSAVYAFVKIGEKYTAGTMNESNLPHKQGEDFSTSQVTAMLPLKSREKAVELIEAEEIRPDMTVAEIKDVVKFYKDEGKEESETAGEAESEALSIDDEIHVDPAEVVFNDIYKALDESKANTELSYDDYIKAVRKAVNTWARANKTMVEAETDTEE